MAELQVPLNLLYRLFQVTEDMVSVIDFQGRFLYVNPAWSRNLGHGPSDLIGREYIEFVHPDDAGRTTEESERLQGSDYITSGFENRYRHADGSYRWIRWNAVSDERMGLYFSVCRDVTERRTAVERAKQAEQDLADFTYMTCHDLRSPLTTARLTIEMLRHQGTAADDRVETLDRTMTAMDELITGLEQFARLEAEPTILTATDLQAALQTTRKDLPGLPDDVVLDIRADPLPAVKFTPAFARHLWYNMLSNTIKYRRGDTVRFQVTGHGNADGTVILQVHDHGIGIPREKWGEVFLAGARARAEHKPHGSGLGLALCERIVRRAGGTMRVKDSRPDEGTTFEIVLQAADQEDEP